MEIGAMGVYPAPSGNSSHGFDAEFHGDWNTLSANIWKLLTFIAGSLTEASERLKKVV